MGSPLPQQDIFNAFPSVPGQLRSHPELLFMLPIPILQSIIQSSSFPAVFLLLLAMSFLSKRIRFYIRISTYYALVALVGAFGAAVALILSLAGRKHISQWVAARAFWLANYAFLGFRCAVENEELLRIRPAIFVMNHQSYSLLKESFDILLLARVFPKFCSVTAKSNLKWYPFFGWYLSWSGTVFVDRANRENTKSAFDSAVRHIKSAKQSVWLFPEGTRSNSTKNELLPFKKGSFHLAVQAQVPIVPIVVENYSHLFNWEAFTFKSGTIRIKVLEPILTTGMTTSDVSDLTVKTRQQMMTALKEISRPDDDNLSKSFYRKLDSKGP